ncbi:glycosyltransferase [Aliagarivorans marinus]|uniref:glycosyltransferase n=1 Tax=Aliagarivorans marinus TaxID=561965 RepID=UPI0003F9FE86|nr:glycosyltransferase [Aliagarivorans marinus]
MSQQLRVVHIISGDLWAGAEVQAFTLLQELRSQCRLKVIVLNHGVLSQRLEKRGFDTCVLDESKLSFKTLLREIHRQLRLFQAQVVHTHRQKEHVLGSLANLLSVRASCYRTVHGDSEFSPSFKQRLQLAADKFCGRYLQDNIIAVSNELKAKLSEQFPAEKIKVIENGISIDEAELTAATPVRSNPARYQVGFVGRIEPVKRPDLFVATAKLLVSGSNAQHWHFHVFGDGSLAMQMQQQVATAGLTENFSFYGHQSAVRAAIRQLDALLMPSDHEGLPMTALESLALGTPIICHGVGGLRDLLSSRPEYLVEQHQAKAYARTLNDVMELTCPPLPAQYRASRNAEQVMTLYQAKLD